LRRKEPGNEDHSSLDDPDSLWQDIQTAAEEAYDRSPVLAVLSLGLGLHPLRRRLPAWSAALPAYLIGTLAAFWMLERLAGP